MSVAVESGLPHFADMATLVARSGIAKSTWLDWRARGLIRGYKFPGGQVRYRISSGHRVGDRL